MPLYVYMVPRGPIEKWFVDLAACFGAVVSEWSYAVEIAVIKWCLQNDPLVVGSQCPLATLEGFVDNWFLIGSVNDASFHSKWAHVKECFTKLGVKMHEEQSSITGPVNAIGWDWNTTTGVFSCPSDKLFAARALISEWSQRALSGGAFSVLEIEKLVGLQRWVATACPSFRLLPICKRLVSPFRKLEVLPPSMLVPLKLSTSSVRFSLRGMGSAQYRPVSRLFTVLNSLFARMLLRVMAAEASACPSPLARAVSMRAFMPGAPRRKHKLLDTG